MTLKAWLRICVFLTLPSLGLSAAAVVMAGGLHQQFGLVTNRVDTFEQKISHGIASNREMIDLVSEQLRLQSPADHGHSRIDARIFMINSQLAQAPKPIVVIGDSITEAARFPSEICGRPVINAGVGGATPNTYLSFINYRGLLQPIDASMVVIALGTNNAQAIVPLKQFEPTYRSLIDKLKPKAGKIILAKVPGIEPGTVSQYFDFGRVESINAMIGRLASELNFGLIDFGKLETVDGVHLSANGYKAWLNSIEAGVKAKLGCPKEPSQQAQGLPHR